MGISRVLINDFQLQTMICIFESHQPSYLNWILVILMTEEQQKNSHVLDHITRALYLKNRLFAEPQNSMQFQMQPLGRCS